MRSGEWFSIAERGEKLENVGFLQSQFGSVTLKVEVQNFHLFFSLISTITFCLYLEAFAYPFEGGCGVVVIASVRHQFSFPCVYFMNMTKGSKIRTTSQKFFGGSTCWEVGVVSWSYFILSYFLLVLS